jgi:hypothetical protein
MTSAKLSTFSTPSSPCPGGRGSCYFGRLWTGGGAVDKVENFADVINGWPLVTSRADVQDEFSMQMSLWCHSLYIDYTQRRSNVLNNGGIQNSPWGRVAGSATARGRRSSGGGCREGVALSRHGGPEYNPGQCFELTDACRWVTVHFLYRKIRFQHL